MEKKSKPRLHGVQHSSEILFGIVPLPTVWGHFIFVPLLPPHPPRQALSLSLIFLPYANFSFPLLSLCLDPASGPLELLLNDLIIIVFMGIENLLAMIVVLGLRRFPITKCFHALTMC